MIVGELLPTHKTGFVLCFREMSTVRPEKFQFMEKGQNHNFDYKIVISVKNPKLIL